MIDAVIVEDSELARFELEHQLKAHPQIRIVGQAADVDSGVALIDREAPGLVFLDVDLPGGNAFDLLARLERVPQIIFTTATSSSHCRHSMSVPRSTTCSNRSNRIAWLAPSASLISNPSVS